MAGSPPPTSERPGIHSRRRTTPNYATIPPNQNHGGPKMPTTRKSARRAALPAALTMLLTIAIAALWAGQITPPPVR